MKISIIIPVYNKQRYLNTLLHQIETQTFRNYECLLINDGSTDGSGTICDNYAAQDPRFHVFHIPNGGVSHARNIGLDHASGEYITFIDGDDEISDNYLENLVHCTTRSSAEIVISGYRKFWDASSHSLEVFHPDFRGPVSIDKVLPSFAQIQQRAGLFGCCAAKIFRRDFLQDIRFDETVSLAEDFDFYLSLYAKANSLYFDDHCLYHYRQDAENSSVKVSDADINYYAQFQINLRYRTFLIDADSYCGVNKSIVDQNITNYIYFTLFYCKPDLFRFYFDTLYALYQQHCFFVRPHGWKQTSVLFLFLHHRPIILKSFLNIYHTVRFLIRGHLNG